MLFVVILGRPSVGGEGCLGCLPLRLFSIRHVNAADVMGCVEGHIGEPWAILIFADEIASRLREEIPAVAFDTMFFVAEKHVVFAMIGVLEVVDVAGAETEEVVKAAFGGATARCESDVPLPKATRRVASFFEILRQDPLPMG